MQHVLIRCDASKKIGLGHVTRCLALAKDFRNHGHRVVFAMNNFDFGVKNVQSEGFEVHIKDENISYFDWIINLVTAHHIKIFIGDVRDNLPLKIILALKQKKVLTVAIDEPSDYAKACDLCFYPPHATIDTSRYSGRVFQGFEYVILREEFYRPFTKTSTQPPRILIMMGGTDVYNVTLPLLKHIVSLKLLVSISIILPKEHPQYALIQGINHDVTLYSNIQDMPQFLSTIDCALIMFGTSAYELVAMEVPSLHICFNDEQFRASEMFEKNGFSRRYMVDDIQCIKHLPLGEKIISPMTKNHIYKEIICV